MNATLPSHYRDIEQVLINYAVALDRRQYALLSEVFTGDAVALYVGLRECHGLTSIVEMISSVLCQCTATQHMLSNFRIDIHGGEASAECYLQAIHTGRGEFSDAIYTYWGEYKDKLVLTDAGWRICHRELRPIHAMGNIGLEINHRPGTHSFHTKRHI